MANQGIYHPTYNPNGSKKLSDGNFWYNTTIPIASTMDCFDPAKLLTESGYIGTVSGRPDGLFYDQVHESGIQDLRNSSKKVEDYNRLISREFNKLVAGTYRGFEGEWLLARCTSVDADNTSNATISSAQFVNYQFLIGDNITIGSVLANGTINWYSRRITNIVASSSITLSSSIIRGSGGYIISLKSTRTKSNTLLHCDIIGNPINYPTAWKESGVFGTPLIVAEDGTSLLPDGVLDNFKLSRKANVAPLLCLRSTDSGATWTSFTPTFSASTNAITLTDEPANNLVQVFYQTRTSMAVPVANSEVLEIGDVFASNYIANSIINSLINKVVINAGGGSGNTPRQFLGKPTNYGLENPNSAMITSDGYRDIPQNKAVSITPRGSPACKVFPYLTRKNGKAYLNLVFKEMKYGSYLAPTTVTEASATYTQNLTYKINIAGCALDGKVIKWVGTTATSAINWSLYDVSPTGVIYLLSTGVVYTNAKLYDGDSWGDSNKFEIVDNVSTTTDDNGQTVLIGQKTVELSYFIDAGE